MALDLGRHLLESTFFALIAALLILSLPKRSAASRHVVWLIAVVKFVVPGALFLLLGTALRNLLPSTPVAARVPVVLLRWASPIATSWPSEHVTVVFKTLIVIWAIGASMLLVMWSRKIWASLALLKRAGDTESAAFLQLQRRAGLRKELRLRFSDSVSEPVLVGFWKPAVFVPATLRQSLSPTELESVILHELAHAKRHDNWTAAFAHIVSCVFWFYPLLWWIERRMHGEREMACDEMVVCCGAEPEDYVASILKVCQLHLSGGVAGVSGVCGSSLRNRMEAIMSLSRNAPLRRIPRTLLGSLIAAIAVVPLTLGFFTASNSFGQVRAQAQAAGKSKAGWVTVSCAAGPAGSFPEGTVIQIGNEPQLMCARVLNPGDINNMDAPPSYHAQWIHTNDLIRARAAKVVHLPEPPPAPPCAPKAPVQKGLCSCEDGGLNSPGAIVNSAKGPYQLRCGRDGSWIATRTRNVERK